MTWLRIAFYGSSLALFLFACLLGFTVQGLKLVIHAVNASGPASMTVGAYSGSLYTDVEFQDLGIEVAGNRLRIEQLRFRWLPAGLLSGKLHFAYISADDVQLELADNSTAAAPVNQDLPTLPLIIDRFRLDQLQVNRADASSLLQLNLLTFSLVYRDGQYYFNDLLLQHEAIDLHVNGAVEMSKPYTTSVNSQIVVTAEGQDSLRADLRVTGNQNGLLGNFRFHEILDGHASVSVKGPLLTPTWKANIALENFKPARFNPALPDLVTDISLRMEGDMTSLRASGEAPLVYTPHTTEDAGQDAEPAREIRLSSSFEFTALLDGGDLLVTLQTLRISSAEGDVDFSGLYRHATREFEVDAAWDSLRWPVAAHDLELVSSGRANLAGRVDDYAFSLDLGLNAGAAYPPLHIVAPGSGDLAGLSFAAARISTAGASLQARGRLDWQDSPTLDLHWQAEGLDPARQWPEWPGLLAGSGDLHLGRTDGAWTWNLSGASLSGQLRSLPFDLALDSSSSPAGDIALRARLSYAEATASVEGKLGEELDLDWNIDVADFARAHPQMQGQLRSNGHLAGSYTTPRVRAEVQAANIRSPWGNTGSLAANLQFDLSVNAGIEADIRLQDLDYDELHISQVNLQVDGSNSQHRFSLLLDLPGASTELSGEGQLLGTAWQGRVNSLRLRHDRYRDWEIQRPVSLGYSKQALQLQELCLHQHSTVLCAAGEYQLASRAWHLSASVEQLALSALLPTLPASITLEGYLQARMQLDGKAARPLQGEAVIELPSGRFDFPVSGDLRKQLAIDGSRLQMSLADGVIRASGGIATVDEEIRPFSTDFQISGLDTDRPSLAALSINGRLEGGIRNLALISAFIPRITETRGSADLDLRVSGSLAEPDYAGSLLVKEAGFSSSDLGIEVGGINLEGKKVANDRYEIAGDLHSGDGRLQARAEIATVGKQGPVFDVRLDGENFELLNLPELWALVNPDLRGELSLKQRSYQGTIKIPAANIDLDEITLVSGVSEDEIIDGQEAEDVAQRYRRQVAVTLSLGDEVQISGKGISGKLRGKLDVSTGKRGDLIGDGEIVIVDGLFSAYRQKLVIEEGRLIFRKSALDNPVLSVTASRTVGDVKVGLKVTGYLDAPNIVLFSSSSMPQEQILAYIIFGRPLDSLSSGEGSDLLGAAASIGLQNSGFITDKVAARFGLDQLGISGATTQSASLVVGKYINPRLYLSYGLGIFDKISRARLRYDLSRRFSLEAERGLETGVDIYYQLEK